MKQPFLGIVLALTAACSGAAEGPQGINRELPIPRAQGLSMIPENLPPVSEDLTLPARAEKLRDAGIEPTRLAAFVNLIPPDRRRQFFWLLDSGSTMFLHSSKGSQDEALLKAAQMTEEERAAWAEKKRRAKAQ